LALRSCALKETHLTVDFSEGYGGLTDVDLTLADYCVVLTLCQLDGIDSVEITVAGRPLSYRSQQTLTAQDVILTTQQAIFP
jgi:germination protein M